ncbi:MAG: SipW-dependent-type signal peptide-containing protein [Rhodococcus sp. (in: high G+C Gram-positive bacteria)]|uniref:SipW-dependent-type signal peptide-containing protein n=1 Tax=Rhodococcus sp. TaxID=1831 RepID=UPI003BB10BB9
MTRGADSTSRRVRLGSLITGAVGVRVRAILALGIVLGLGAVGTLALWSNSAVATSGVFSTGTIDLRVNEVDTYSFTGTSGLTMTNMLPGESRAATLQVQNKLSTLPVTYSMAAGTAAGSPLLADYIQLRVFGSASPTNAASGGLNTGSCSGAQIASAALRAGASVPVITAPQPLVAATGTQDLCFVAALAANAPLSVQSQTLATITLTFNATTA